MKNNLKETLKKNLHPYLFALKEGKKIRKDFLDYSLLMIHIQNTEIFKSPTPYDYSMLLEKEPLETIKNVQELPPLAQNPVTETQTPLD